MAILLGLDPGFSSVGFSLVDIDKQGNTKVLEIGVWTTTKSDKKLNVLATEDNFRRAKLISGYLHKYASKADAICVEGMSYPRNASTVAKMALFWGALASVVEILDLPVVQVSPQGIKKYLCEKNNASKEEVKSALLDRFSSEDGSKIVLDAYLSRYPKTRQEHGFDALGAVVSAADSDIILAIRKFA